MTDKTVSNLHDIPDYEDLLNYYWDIDPSPNSDVAVSEKGNKKSVSETFSHTYSHEDI